MSRRRAEVGGFTLYRRADGYWGYWTYDRFGRRHRYATGTRSESESWELCIRRKMDGTLIWEDHRPAIPVYIEVPTLAEYGKGFWNYDTSPVIQDRLARGGHFTRKLAATYAGFFANHIVPTIGQMRITDITKADVNAWLLSLKDKGLAPKTANNVLIVIRSMLSQAVDDGILERSPADGVKPLIGQSTRRGCFTLEQIRLLFDGGWEAWGDKYSFTACYLASRTGMRSGEVLALQPQQIHPKWIDVDASWSQEDGRKCTKSGYGRTVPITSELYWMLMEICPPTKEGYIFTKNGVKPVKDDFFRDALRRRMRAINMDFESQGKPVPFDLDGPNPLTFHSFRHFLNTRLIAEDVPANKILAVIGHESTKMTEHYAHLGAEDLRAIASIQEGLA